ncbi:MAG: molecular chaperone HtpG [Pseudomonadota bacterium]
MTDTFSEFEFKAEIRQLLDILVHSLYTNKEIFIRELVSNASDALDKMRFELNRGTEATGTELPLEIRITADKDQNRLVISDTGVGMTKAEIVENIGTIAKSGSAEFLKAAESKAEKLENLIGKFGVGFYSVFMAAGEVVIKSRSYKKDEKPVMWKSDGLGSYQLAELEEDLPRGTRVEIHLKDDAKEFAENYRITAVINKHSNFISFPIFVDDERVNTVSALWREPKFSIKQEQYDEFYKFLTFDSQAPQSTIHVAVDAPIQYNALLFIPPRSHDLFGLARDLPGVDLYVRRVLIKHGDKDLLPEYLGFARGVVDSEDLPLNISRETLQENMMLRKISSNLAKQILNHLEKMAKDDRGKYEEFWKEHGKLFKLGYGDFANRDKYAGLLRFNSSHCDDSNGLASLDEYIGRVKSGQKEIFYVSGPSREAATLNPHLEIFRSKGLEVLYLFEPLDEFALETIKKYGEFELKPVEHVDSASLGTFETLETKETAEPLGADDEKDFQKFLDKIKDILEGKAESVRVSSRLSQSPVCLVNPDGGMTSSMEKILKIASKDASIPTKVLEVNKDHRLIRNLFAIYKENPNDSYLGKAVMQLFESALLLEGYLRDPYEMVGRIQYLLEESSGWRAALPVAPKN